MNNWQLWLVYGDQHLLRCDADKNIVPYGIDCRVTIHGETYLVSMIEYCYDSEVVMVSLRRR